MLSRAVASFCDFAVKYHNVATPVHMGAFSASGQTLMDKFLYKDNASASGQTNAAMSSDMDVAAASGQLAMSLDNDAVLVSNQRMSIREGYSILTD